MDDELAYKIPFGKPLQDSETEEQRRRDRLDDKVYANDAEYVAFVSPSRGTFRINTTALVGIADRISKPFRRQLYRYVLTEAKKSSRYPCTDEFYLTLDNGYRQLCEDWKTTMPDTTNQNVDLDEYAIVRYRPDDVWMQYKRRDWMEALQYVDPSHAEWPMLLYNMQAGRSADYSIESLAFYHDLEVAIVALQQKAREREQRMHVTDVEKTTENCDDTKPSRSGIASPELRLSHTIVSGRRVVLVAPTEAHEIEPGDLFALVVEDEPTPIFDPMHSKDAKYQRPIVGFVDTFDYIVRITAVAPSRRVLFAVIDRNVAKPTTLAEAFQNLVGILRTEYGRRARPIDEDGIKLGHFFDEALPGMTEGVEAMRVRLEEIETARREADQPVEKPDDDDHPMNVKRKKSRR